MSLNSPSSSGFLGSVAALGLTNITKEEYIIIYNCVAVMNILSIIGCVFNIIVAVVLKNHRSAVGKMVIGLSIADSILAITTLATNQEMTNNLICQIITFLMQFGFGGSLGLSCCFSHALYTILREQHSEVLHSYWKFYSVITLSAAISNAVASVLTTYNNTENEAMQCAHITGTNNYISDLFVMTIPVTIAIFYTIYFYLASMGQIKKYGGRWHLELLLYPLILIISDVPYTILGLLPQFEIDIGYSALLICDILFYSQGFLNAFAYGLSKSITHGIKKCCRRSHRPSQTDRTSQYDHSIGVHIRNSLSLITEDY